MRKPDKLVFAACAIDKGLWLLVRRTTPAHQDHTHQTVDVFGPEGEYFALETQASIPAAGKFLFDRRFTNPIYRARNGPKRSRTAAPEAC